MSDSQQPAQSQPRPTAPAAQWYFPPKGPGKGRVFTVVLLSVLGVALSVTLWWFFLGPGADDGHVPPAAPPTPVASDTTQTPTPLPTSPTPIVIPTPVFSTTPEDAAGQTVEPERPTLEAFTEWAMPYFYEAEAALAWIGDGTKEDAAATASNLLDYADALAHARAPESVHEMWELRSAHFLSSAQVVARIAETGASTTEATSATQSALTQLRAVLTTSPPTPTPTSPTSGG